MVPNVNVFQADNRSKYNALMLHLAGNTSRFNLVANYTLSRANTWGCLLGELFDYVDGVCQQPNGQLNAFRARRLRTVWRKRYQPLRPGLHGTRSRWIPY